MSRVLNLKEVDNRLQKLVQSLRSSNEECEVKDERGDTVAVVLPVERYESYQAHQRRREANFAILDKVAEDLKDYDPDFIEGLIEKAEAEVKAEAANKRVSG